MGACERAVAIASSNRSAIALSRAGAVRADAVRAKIVQLRSDRTVRTRLSSKAAPSRSLLEAGHLRSPGPAPKLRSATVPAPQRVAYDPNVDVWPNSGESRRV